MAAGSALETPARRAAALDDACCPPECEPPLSGEDAQRYAQLLKALADPQRLRIFSLIAAQPPDEPLCVCDIETGFELSQGTISHHLKVLREAGLVSVDKRGTWHYFTPTPDALAPVQTLLRDLSR